VQASLRIGCVKYLNARPLIRGWRGQIEFDHPSTLCRRLANGELDVALVSSFEFLCHPIYQIVDDIAIASDGPVYSVFVAYERGTWLSEIELDPASATGVAMLRYLIAERGQKFLGAEAARDNLSPLEPRRARLLIGDQAIRFRQKFGETYKYWDLGEEWRGVTKLPFVYALWLIRPEVTDPKTIADRLRAVRDENLENLDALIAAEKDLDQEFATTYYRDYLRFHFGEKEKKGLRMFHELCAKHGLLPEREIEFALV
jgi:chorismate dehydratase